MNGVVKAEFRFLWCYFDLVLQLETIQIVHLQLQTLVLIQLLLKKIQD